MRKNLILPTALLLGSFALGSVIAVAATSQHDASTDAAFTYSAYVESTPLPFVEVPPVDPDDEAAPDPGAQNPEGGELPPDAGTPDVLSLFRLPAGDEAEPYPVVVQP